MPARWTGDNNGSALCDTGGYELGAVPPPAPVTTTTTVTITYGYDKLYRLTSATYSDGKVFTYTYDSVGNRLTQTTLTNTTVYTYDLANRLTNVGPTTYTWDANGNLLNDGVYTYTYDAANRLITVTQGANVYAFAYNGLGDRLRQTANGVPTTYTLDLNAGLTQVLVDGANTYLYGTTRIGEQQPRRRRRTRSARPRERRDKICGTWGISFWVTWMPVYKPGKTKKPAKSNAI